MSTSNKISTLWIVILFNMVFADIFGFLLPETLQGLATATTEGVSLGSFEGVVITPAFILVAAIFVEVPIIMIYLSKTLNRRGNRIANFAACAVTGIFIVGGGSLQPHYIFFASVEIACLGYIVLIARRWTSD